MRNSKKRSDGKLYHFDKNYGFWGTPNIRKIIEYPEFGKSIFVFHDIFGNRSTCPERKDLNSKKSPILFVGGSHTWGAGVENTETFPAIFENKTGLLSLNYGHCSFGLDQIILVLLRELKRIKPDVVVIELHPWVIHRVLRKSALGFPKPFFILKNEVLNLVKVPRISSVPFLRWVISDYSEFEKKYAEFMADVDLENLIIDEQADPLYKLWNQDYYADLYSIIRKLVIIARDECARNDAKLLFILGPTKQELMHSSKKYGLINPFMPRRRLKAIMEIESVQFLDLFPDFDLLKNSVDSGIFPDGHINNLGHEIFADRIIEEFTKSA